MTHADIQVLPVRSRSELKRFIRLPARLNAGDPAWITPLTLERMDALSAKNPFFAHADVQFWLAVRHGRDVGRISAQIDQLAPRDPARPAGAFGLIAAEDDPAIFEALFAQAEAWLKARGMVSAMGPFNLSVNEEIGLLIDGFETPPMVMMGHDPRYVGARIEEQGYAKAKDVFAYLAPVRNQKMSPALLRRVSRDQPAELTLRPLDMSRYAAEVAKLTEILNDAWKYNWGFTPTTEAETKHLAESLRPIVDPRLVWFAELKGDPIAVLVLLPNLNEAIAGLDGRLLPFGWAKLLWRLKVRGLKTLRLPLMGVKREYARTVMGQRLPFQLIAAAAAQAEPMGYEQCEFSWVLEDNMPMRNICEAWGAKIYKTYRIYEKALA
jgi:GNAT superfamily N-acetyltransferase